MSILSSLKVVPDTQKERHTHTKKLPIETSRFALRSKITRDLIRFVNFYRGGRRRRGGGRRRGYCGGDLAETVGYIPPTEQQQQQHQQVIARKKRVGKKKWEGF